MAVKKISPSPHLQVRLQRAGGLDRLQDTDHVPRSDAQRVQAGDQITQGDARGQDSQLLVVLVVDIDPGSRNSRGCPGSGEGVRLTDLRRLGYSDGQIALCDRNRADAHVRAHYYRAARLIYDHDRGVVRFDPQILDHCQRLDGITVGQVELHGTRICRPGDLTGSLVDNGSDSLGGRQVGV